MRLCCWRSSAYAAPSRPSRRVDPSMSLKTKVTVPTAVRRPPSPCRSAARGQPELQLDVVGVTEHDDRADRRFRDRRELHTALRQFRGTGLELVATRHGEREVVEPG